MDDIVTTTTTASSKLPSLSNSNVLENSTNAVSNSTTSFASNINWWTILKYTALLLILALLGFNLFTYLGIATDKTAQQIQPIASTAGKSTSSAIKQTVNVGAEGTKQFADVAAGSVTSGLEILEKGLNNPDKIANERMLKDALAKQHEPIADDIDSPAQVKNSKAGFCYIGSDRGVRSCIRVGEDDRCMSGDIFPTKDLCINPNLRQ